MHIEAGVVEGGKMVLGYATGAATMAVGFKMVWENVANYGIVSYLLKSLLATAIVFSCFEILPHYPVGVSEVHLILGTTIFLIFGIAPAAFGLMIGLLVQGLFFAPFDLPQYGINVTTLLASLLILHTVAGRVIPEGMAYKDIGYSQLLKLSVAWEGAIVSWVAFWALYGQGFGAENLSDILAFGSSYMLVVIIEPLIDLAVLAAVKTLYREGECKLLFESRLLGCKAAF